MPRRTTANRCSPNAEPHECYHGLSPGTQYNARRHLMSQAVQARRATEALTAEITYTVDTGEKLVNETYGPNNMRRRRTGTEDPRMMTIMNRRMPNPTPEYNELE